MSLESGVSKPDKHRMLPTEIGSEPMVLAGNTRGCMETQVFSKPGRKIERIGLQDDLC